MTASSPLHPRFRDLLQLGAGGMGIVYRAFDRKRRQAVALKTLPKLEPEEVYMLKSEFRALADVRHPNLVELYDLFVDESACFFTMELIDGVDLVSFIDRNADVVGRSSGSSGAHTAFDQCVAQLAMGVRALHDAGKLHRDIKPQNILVTRQGRLVLLDFGLAIPLRASQHEPEFTGTLAYMSPEQASGQPLSPKSDWYSVGVVLYEAVTHDLPESGPLLGRSSARRGRGPDPRARVPAVAKRHATLIASLLDPDPGRRPGAEDILASLDGHIATVPSSVPVAEHEFVGRVDELRRLRDVFALADQGPVSVHIAGESGIGKTALLEHFTDSLERNDAALVLRGRCHPHESVPFKALDGVIDALTSHLLRAKDLDVAALLPPDVDALLQLFPVLGRVPELTAGKVQGTGQRDPIETRRRGAAALRAVLASLSAVRPVVVWIDDLQWGDADSPLLLRIILGDGDVPKLLLVVSYRAEDRTTSPLLVELARMPLEADLDRRHQILLGPLAPDEARTFARRLLKTRSASDDAVQVATEAGGSPFFIQQFARTSGAASPDRSRPAFDVGTVIADRLSTLDTDSRRILDLVSLAAAPLAPAIVLEMASLGPEGLSRLTMMQAESLLRLTPFADGEAVRPYHDRIREAVAADIAPEPMRAYHLTLARGLAARPDTDPEALGIHYLGAGVPDTAVVYVQRAAQRAAEALAFDRAATLYGQALSLIGPDVDRQELLTCHAEALAYSGRTGQAGARFHEAAKALAVQDPTSPRLLELRQSAAENFLRSGRFDEGTAILGDVLEALRIKRPRSAMASFLRAFAIRLPNLAGTLGGRGAATPTPETSKRLEMIWRLAMSVTLTDHPLGAFLGAMYIREALHTTVPSTVAQAIGYEAAMEASVGGRYFQRRAQRLLDQTDPLVEQGVEPVVVATLHAFRGSCAWFDGRWRDAERHSRRSIEVLGARCRGVAWETATAQLFLVSALAFLGDMQELSRTLEALLKDATERGDLFAANNYRLGQQSFHRLASDDPESVLEIAAQAEASMPRNVFHIQHYHHVTITTQTHLYRREPERAWRILQHAWPGLRAAQQLRLVFPRAELLQIRARVALALVESQRNAANESAPRRIEWRSGSLLRHAAHLARRVRRARTVPAAPFADTIDAGIAFLQGNPDASRWHLERAVEGYTRADMLLHREAARYRLGQLTGGDAGKALVSAATDALAGQVKRPEAIAWTLVPGFAGLAY
jgi:hypothetical protein